MNNYNFSAGAIGGVPSVSSSTSFLDTQPLLPHKLEHSQQERRDHPDNLDSDSFLSHKYKNGGPDAHNSFAHRGVAESINSRHDHGWGWHENIHSNKEVGNSPAVSALALLGFLFFLHLIQNSLQNNRMILTTTTTSMMSSNMTSTTSEQSSSTVVGRRRKKREVGVEENTYELLELVNSILHGMEARSDDFNRSSPAFPNIRNQEYKPPDLKSEETRSSDMMTMLIHLITSHALRPSISSKNKGSNPIKTGAGDSILKKDRNRIKHRLAMQSQVQHRRPQRNKNASNQVKMTTPGSLSFSDATMSTTEMSSPFTTGQNVTSSNESKPVPIGCLQQWACTMGRKCAGQFGSVAGVAVRFIGTKLMPKRSRYTPRLLRAFTTGWTTTKQCNVMFKCSKRSSNVVLPSLIMQTWGS